MLKEKQCSPFVPAVSHPLYILISAYIFIQAICLEGWSGI